MGWVSSLFELAFGAEPPIRQRTAAILPTIGPTAAPFDDLRPFGNLAQAFRVGMENAQRFAPCVRG